MFWAKDCFAAFLPSVKVQSLGWIERLDPAQTWRGAQGFRISLRSGPMYLYNSHQPASRKHGYSAACRTHIVANLIEREIARRTRVLNERVRLTALWRRIDLSLKAAAEGSWCFTAREDQTHGAAC